MSNGIVGIVQVDKKVQCGSGQRNGKHDDERNQRNAKKTCDGGRREHDTKKNDKYLNASLKEKVEIIKELTGKHEVKLLCRVFGVGRSTYYAALKREPGKRSVENIEFEKMILKIWTESKKRYGCVKIQKMLSNKGIKAGVDRVLRHMRKMNIRSIVSKRFKKHSKEADKTDRPNLVNRRFHADKPNQLWLTDITYIRTAKHGWTYLAAVLDMCTRKIVGWSYSKTMTAELACDALRNAWKNQGSPKNVIIHSDRGSQYTSRDYADLTQTLGFTRSFSAKGCPFDNAPMESFNAILKKEEVYLNSYTDFDTAKIALFDYIEGFYNRNRIHSAIGFVSPAVFEAAFVG